MTEKSYLWTTGGAGDGASTYTRADWSNIAKVLSSVRGDYGVGPGLESSMVGSVPSANTVRIAPGGALVDGRPYFNDANLDVNIPSAVGAGNTRIDRVVLRADWTAQTVRVTRIAGVDAASPSAPSVTRTAGTTWDLYLYQALVNTSGAVTITDERDLGADPMGKRQGGSLTAWATPGSVNYPPGTVKIQTGTVNMGTPTVGGSLTANVTFPEAFSGTPLVFLTVALSQSFIVCPYAVNVSTTGFQAYTWNVDLSAAGDQYVNWLAIGPA